MWIYLIIMLGAGFLVLWYTTHRVMQSHGDADGHADAFSSLKKLTFALLILFAIVAMQLLVGAAVWFGLGFFFPDLPAEWRMQLAIAVAMIAWGMLFAVPRKPSSK